MTDYFTERFIDDPKAFAALHERLKRYGYVTEDDEPCLSRPIYNSLSAEHYQRMFEMHNTGQYTEIEAAPTAFDVGYGFRSFYVIYDRMQFPDESAVKGRLIWHGILK
jgi:hypothetical protein